MTDIMSQPAANEQNADKANTPVPSEFMIGLQEGHRLATFQECDKFGELMGEPIYFLFVDGDMSIESQWQTPFESSNPENKLPSLMAGLQSGTLVEALVSLGSKIGAFLDLFLAFFNNFFASHSCLNCEGCLLAWSFIMTPILLCSHET